MSWDIADYIIMGVMLLSAALTVGLALRKSLNRLYRAAVALLVAGSFITIWMNLAVGIIGNENNPLNLMYAGVLAVLFIGSLIARFRAVGMVRVMIATAIAQAIVAVIAQYHGHFTWVITLIFMGVWLSSAQLFRKSLHAPFQKH